MSSPDLCIMRLVEFAVMTNVNVGSAGANRGIGEDIE